MKIDGRFLNTLRSRLSIAEIVGEKVKLTKKGREYTGLCPFHHEKTPSFTVSEDKEFYHCFGCGAHGDVVKFLTDAQHYTFIEAVRELAQRAGISMPVDTDFSRQEQPQVDMVPLKEALIQATDWFHKNLFLMKYPEGLRYTERRGLTRNTLKKFSLGYALNDYHSLETHLKAQGFSDNVLLETGLSSRKDENSSVHDRFRRRLMFPIHDHKGQVVGFGGRLLESGEPKYLNSPETILFSKGHLLYGYFFAKEKALSDPLIIVEGYMDVISLQQAGYKGAVAPLGTALTEDQILLAWRLSPEPVLCFDGDNAGLKAAARAAERVLPLLKPGFSLRFALLPTGEDPDSFVRKGTSFDILLKEALPLVDMLWMILTTGKSFKTPEQKTALEKKIQHWCQAIQDSAVRKNYQYAFKDLFYQNIVKLKDTQRVTTPIKRRKIDFFHIHHRLLLAILINHPNLISVVSDDLAFLDFKEERLHDMREQILDYYANQHAEKSTLKNFLIEAGFKTEIEGALSPSVLIHGAFAKSTATEEAALEGWKDIFNRIQQSLSKADLDIAKENLAQEMSIDSWNRLKMLKLNTLKQD